MELNDTVKVTLTKTGADLLNKVLLVEEYKEGDTYVGQLWLMFYKFKETIGWGQLIPFTNIELINE